MRGRLIDYSPSTNYSAAKLFGSCREFSGKEGKGGGIKVGKLESIVEIDRTRVGIRSSAISILLPFSPVGSPRDRA